MRILVVNQYFHPDQASTAQLLTELCEDLAEHHEVTVVAGRPSYNPTETFEAKGLVTEDLHGNVRILRTWSTAFPRHSMAGRLANYASYIASSLAGALLVKDPDVVLTMTDPPIVAVVAFVVSRLRRAPFVYINQDIFPEVGVRLGRIRNPLLVRGLAALNRGLRRRAARVVAIGRDMERRLLALGTPPERIAVIPNWADGALIHPLTGPSALRSEQGWESRYVVMHSGNVGLSQGLETVLDAASLLSDVPQVLMAIVGDGAGKPSLEAAAKAKGLGNLVFLPYQPKASLADLLGAADIHLVSLRRGLSGYIVPSKVYGVMAAGKPFLAAVDPGSEPALLVAELGCGVAIPPDDPKALADAIRRSRDMPLAEMGRRARTAFDARFERKVATETYRRLLEDVASHGPNRPRS